jgi:hypothetical protein
MSTYIGMGACTRTYTADVYVQLGRHQDLFSHLHIGQTIIKKYKTVDIYVHVAVAVVLNLNYYTLP